MKWLLESYSLRMTMMTSDFQPRGFLYITSGLRRRMPWSWACWRYVAVFSVAQRLKHLPAMRETWVRSLGQEDPLEKEMATHSSIIAWRIPWMEEPGGQQSTGSQRVGHNRETSLSLSVVTLVQLDRCSGLGRRVWTLCDKYEQPLEVWLNICFTKNSLRVVSWVN